MSAPTFPVQVDLTAQKWPIKPGGTYLFTPGPGEYLVADGQAYTAQTTFTYGGGGAGVVSYHLPLQSTVQQVWQGVNNTIAVFDYLTKAWAGYDDGTDLAPQELITYRLDGEDRLIVFGADGLGAVYEDLDAGDQVRSQSTASGVAEIPITMEVVTRGYNFQQQGQNRVAQVEVTGNSLGSTFSVSVETPGGVVSKLVDQWTPDRTQYSQPAFAARWVDGNVNGDATVPFRLDYSLVVPTSGYVIPAAGCPLGWLADWQRRFRPGPTFGRAVRVRYTNWAGQGELISVVPAAQAGERRSGLL